MTPLNEILKRRRQRVVNPTANSPLRAELDRISKTTPSNAEMEKIFERNPELRELALGEDYDKSSPSLYRIQQQGGNVAVQPWSENLPDGTPAMEMGLPRPMRDMLRRARSQVLTPTNREAITRSRTTEPMSEIDPEGATRQRTVTFDPQTGKPNETFYRDRNDAAGLYDAYRNWEPRGAKRGFKNSLKSALLMGAEAVRANPDDPLAAAAAGLVVGAGGGTAAPNFLNRLRRQQRLPELAAEAGSELERSKTQAQIEAGQMVPITLDSGETVMVPAKTAGTLRSRQQEIGLRGDTLEARKKRWNQLGNHEAARDAQALYNSGAADDSAELRAEIARRLGLPTGTVLPPRGLGNQVKVDEFGNYVVISPRSGEVTDTERGAFAKTQEAGREIRSRRATQAANERARYVQGQINQRQANRPVSGSRSGLRSDTVTGRKAATLIGKIEQRRRTMTRADELLKANPDDAEARAMREKAQAEGEGFAAELNALGAGYEAGPGNLGYPYYKRTGNTSQSGSGISLQGALDAFRREAKREPTADEVENIKRYYGIQ